MAEVCRAPRERSFPLRLTVRFADANNVRRVDGLARFFGVVRAHARGARTDCAGASRQPFRDRGCARDRDDATKRGSRAARDMERICSMLAALLDVACTVKGVDVAMRLTSRSS